MKPVDQMLFGPEGTSDEGNCLPACVASVLELSLDQVPHFLKDPEWETSLLRFLLPLGYSPLTLDANECRSFGYTPSGYHLIGGQGPRGLQHEVVGYKGEMVHDPHPSCAGLIEEEDWTLFVATLDKEDTT